MIKKISKTFLFLCVTVFVYSQNPKVSWGDEILVKKGTTDIGIDYVDNTGGIYIQESHIAKDNYVLFGFLRQSATLIKVGKNLNQEFLHEYDDELKGKEFETFLYTKSKLYLMASDFDKRTNIYTVFAQQIDKSTGEKIGNWKILGTWDLPDYKRNVEFEYTYSYDSSRIILLCKKTDYSKYKKTIEVQYGKRTKEKEITGDITRRKIEFRTYDTDLNAADTMLTTISFEDSVKKSIEEVLITSNSQIVIVRSWTHQFFSKVNDNKNLFTKEYYISVYNKTGKKIFEIAPEMNNKYLLGARTVIRNDGHLFFFSLYCNDYYGNQVNGVLWQNIDINSGNVVSQYNKDIEPVPNASVSMKGNDEDNEDESKEEKKDRKEMELLSENRFNVDRFFAFENFIAQDNESLVIIVEENLDYDFSRTTGSQTMSNAYYKGFEHGNIFMFKIIPEKNSVVWMNVIPKLQKQLKSVGDGNPQVTGSTYKYVNKAYRVPMFAGLGMFQQNSNINLIFSDHPDNKTVLKIGPSFRMVKNFAKADCYVLQLDIKTGKLKRSLLFNNTEYPTSMPRLGYMNGADYYMIGIKGKFLTKSELKLAKLHF